MTPRQQQTLDVIRQHMRTHRLPPTYKELGDALGVSRVSAFGFVRQLEAGGYVKIVAGHRGIRLLDEKCPCCGK